MKFVQFISLKIVNNLLSFKCIGIIYHTIQKPIFEIIHFTNQTVRMRTAQGGVG